MSSTFGEQLVRFVEAVDYIDDRSFDQVRQLVDDYIEEDPEYPGDPPDGRLR